MPLERCSLLGCHWLVGGHRVEFLDGPGGGKRRLAITGFAAVNPVAKAS